MGMQGVKRVEKLFYKISISVLRSDEDLQVLFHCRRQFFEVRTLELLAKLVDVVCSSRGSNRNPQPSVMAACSSSMHVGASSFVPVIALEAVSVASPSFAADLNCNRDGEIGTPDVVPVFGQGGASDGVKDVLREKDDDDDDVEPATIANDSDDDIARSNRAKGSGAASSRIQQYSRTF
ncbi:hypothetical protein Ahy_B10g102310 [Arachis hypogaea]|uniref:Uncharacterized protein n=1 Tax=Arachis hypogaea TaxID=3818 RepID=A0A444X1W3_ARAHY|nr:hypothetical protein Ahy_B10g102310 [Arachis hypogaea]